VRSFARGLPPDTNCTCEGDGEASPECEEDLSVCILNGCDTLQNQRTCYAVAVEESEAASSDDVDAFCYAYTSGPFDNTICEIDNVSDETCTITIDGTEYSSRVPVACGETDGAGTLGFGYDFDCSNIIEGEKWNNYNGDIPETSRFLAFGNTDQFVDDVFLDCGGSGAFALSFHALSVVGLMVVATFW
jgi:hypothetical protein